MSYVKIVLYFLSGLMIVGGLVCIGLFFMAGEPDALAGAVMFLSFGVAGGLFSIYFEQIIGRQPEPTNRMQPAGSLDPINAERRRRERDASAV